MIALACASRPPWMNESLVCCCRIELLAKTTSFGVAPKSPLHTLNMGSRQVFGFDPRTLRQRFSRNRGLDVCRVVCQA